MEAVKRYIAAHYGDEMSVERLSELVYMAPSYLSSVFKKETGQNLNRFIKSVRMEKAKDLLEQTMMKIVDISTACGYPNVSYSSLIRSSSLFANSIGAIDLSFNKMIDCCGVRFK